MTETKAAKLPFAQFRENARSLINHLDEIDALLIQFKHPSRVSDSEERKIFPSLVATGGLRFLSWCFENEVDVKGSEKLDLAGLSNQEVQRVMEFSKSHKAWSYFCIRAYRWSEGYYNEITQLTYRHFILGKTGRMSTYIRFLSFDKMLEYQTEYRVLAAHVSGLLEALLTGLTYADNISPSLGKVTVSDKSVDELRSTAAKLASEIEARQKRPEPKISGAFASKE